MRQKEPSLDHIHAVPDATLGGYIAEHNRPPAFEGSDGMPYTVSIEADRTGTLREPWVGYLVFPKWAETGVGIVGHVETEVLDVGRSEEDVRGRIAELSLDRTKQLLDGAIQARDERTGGIPPEVPSGPADAGVRE